MQRPIGAILLCSLLALACRYEATGAEAYRRVHSKQGYSNASGRVTVPSRDKLFGIGGSGRSAYNYFGVDITWDPNGEYGITCQTPSTTPPGKKAWRLFSNVTVTSRPDKSGFSLTPCWPPPGMVSARYADMDFWVTDGWMHVYISVVYLGLSGMFSRECPGVVGSPGGTVQRVRRVTTLNMPYPPHAGYSLNNTWAGVKISSGGPLVLWQPEHTWLDPSKCPGSSTCNVGHVVVQETNPYYNETVSLWIP